ncbi:MAG: DUF423 domain-containing protein [Methylomonas sp.]|nr:DUF423 domain-containing protein [Methylomonas sp.]PPD22877.1 MAG: hypothetical protein CTY23_00705 [Methylomonas sp.]PPD27402.1 MAG: hypothetical protein CTY22_02220 [Methylomonas sp.]PPD39378.1 MAG: hypothetical protein CTY21_02215 [Methylomonas sp.]PPD41854.1 MAG: hypothetical protein CTY17_02985 [Methylomonas sp.]
MTRSNLLIIAAVSGFVAVAMGAFGAHGLKPLLNDYQLDIYKTAVNYQMWHTLLLTLTAMLPGQRLLRWVAVLLIAGILLFSGSLYLLAIFNIRWLGMITPIGGLAFLGAWALLAWVAYHQVERD